MHDSSTTRVKELGCGFRFANTFAAMSRKDDDKSHLLANLQAPSH